MKSKEGNYVPLTKRAVAIADYSELDHWTNLQQNEQHPSTKIINNNGANESEFTIDELNWALKTTTNNKSPVQMM